MTFHGSCEALAHDAWMHCCGPLHYYIQQRYSNVKFFLFKTILHLILIINWTQPI